MSNPPMVQTKIEDFFVQVKPGKSEATLLPIIENLSGMNVVSSETVASLLRGDLQIEKFLILDCRFDYEFEGGHISQACNFTSHEWLSEMLTGKNWDNVPIIIHCEFSQFRGPALVKEIRCQDRTENIKNYPILCYPELYLMKGGYSEFFSQFPELCSPIGYVPCKQQKRQKALTIIKKRSKLFG